ncbi:MAG: S41 family peptidase [Maribacter sp.]
MKFEATIVLIMKKLFLTFILLFNFHFANSQESEIDYEKIKEDLNEIITDISHNYVYLQEKNVDLNCVKEYYKKQIPNIKTEQETILFFEYLLNEFYDNHLTLRTNTNSSFRLFAPIYTSIKNGKLIVTNIWQTQIKNSNQSIIGAEIIKFNGIEFEQVIKDFPTHCNDKSFPETKEWIANKILAGRYNEPRILSLKLSNKKEIEYDLDSIKLKNNDSLLDSKTINEIGVIRINNSLGNDNLVSEFDKKLNELSNTKGLIIDLRNTVFGGDSYEARGIMSRFISEPEPYQKHSYLETSENNPDIERSWVEYVTPRLEQYKNPVVILVGRWTGSMGEGLAIGFEGIKRAEIVGSEMRRLAGEVYDFSLKNQRYGYKLSTAKLYHINGTIREDYIPPNYVKQKTTEKDETLEKGIQVINKLTK